MAKVGAPSAIQEGACSLREECKSLVWGFIGFLRKTRNISLFSLPILLTGTSFLLTLYIYVSLCHAVQASNTLDPTGDGPQL